MKHFVLDGRNGRFIPQQTFSMYKDHPAWDWSKVHPSDISSLDNGPEDKPYWEAWQSVLDHVSVSMGDFTFFVTQDEEGNVWLKTV
jgi:hypothetical protein